MKHVASKDNAEFKRLRLLAASVAEQRARGRTLIDGPHLVSCWLDGEYKPFQLVVSESGADKAEVRGILQHHPRVPLLSLKDNLFRELSGTQSPVGILAEIPIPPPPTPEAALHSASDWMLLDGIQDAGNVGSILRSAAAFGVTQIFLGEGCAAAWSPKVLRAAQGAHLSLAIHERADLAALLQVFPGHKLATVVDNAQSIYEQGLNQRLLWLMGNEGQGVSPALVRLCDKSIIIPMTKASESLNVAAAAAVCLAETARQKSQRF